MSLITFELALGNNNKVVYDFIRFPESLRTPLLHVISSVMVKLSSGYVAVQKMPMLKICPW